MTTAIAARLGTGILERIGNTPLIRIERITVHLPNVQILAKAEWANPGGSVKDRAASAIVADAQAKGFLGASKATRGQTLLDATSGNTGIAYAMLGAAMDFAVTLCMPANVSPERKKVLAAYGAEVISTDPADGSDGAIRKAREMAAESGDKFYYADQYGNDANWRAHYRSTAPEIWRQTEGQITHFVAGLGTSGTFMGTTRRLKEYSSGIECISMQPDSAFHGLEGMKHMASAIVPAIYDPGLADRNVRRWKPRPPTRWRSGWHVKRVFWLGFQRPPTLRRRSAWERKSPPNPAVQIKIQSLLQFCAIPPTNT